MAGYKDYQTDDEYVAAKRQSLASRLQKAAAWWQTASPAEREAMHKAQRESFARAMAPCEHGVADFEDCPDCRSKP
jgi:hypothetical protein